MKEDTPFSKDELTEWLEKHNIETRPILGGNIMRQPVMQGKKVKSTSLVNSDYIHDNSFYVGAHPGLTDEMKKYIVSVFEEFFANIE